MPEKKSERLSTLKKLAEWKERDAAAELNQQRQRLQSEQQQLRDLQAYYQDYLHTIDGHTQLARAELLNYRNFCQQLSHTIRQGVQRVAHLEKHLDAKKNAWLVCRNKRQVLDEMIVRSAREENHALELRAQKDLDDIWQAQRHRNPPTQ